MTSPETAGSLVDNIMDDFVVERKLLPMERVECDSERGSERGDSEETYQTRKRPGRWRKTLCGHQPREWVSSRGLGLFAVCSGISNILLLAFLLLTAKRGVECYNSSPIGKLWLFCVKS